MFDGLAMREDAKRCATEGCDGLVFGDQTHCQECINERRISVAGKLDRRRLRNKARNIRKNRRRGQRYGR